MRYCIPLFMILFLLALPFMNADTCRGEEKKEKISIEFTPQDPICIPGTTIFRYVVSGRITNITKDPIFSIVLGNLCKLIYEEIEPECQNNQPENFCGACIEHPFKIPFIRAKHSVDFVLWCDVSGSEKILEVLQKLNKELKDHRPTIIGLNVYDPYL